MYISTDDRTSDDQSPLLCLSNANHYLVLISIQIKLSFVYSSLQLMYIIY